MSRQFSSVSRRRFLQTSALGAAAVLHAPAVLRAQGVPVKVGVLHPVSGALSYSGQQGRLGAAIAIEVTRTHARGPFDILENVRDRQAALLTGRKFLRSPENFWISETKRLRRGGFIGDSGRQD